MQISNCGLKNIVPTSYSAKYILRVQACRILVVGQARAAVLGPEPPDFRRSQNLMSQCSSTPVTSRLAAVSVVETTCLNEKTLSIADAEIVRCEGNDRAACRQTFQGPHYRFHCETEIAGDVGARHI